MNIAARLSEVEAEQFNSIMEKFQLSSKDAVVKFLLKFYSGGGSNDATNTHGGLREFSPNDVLVAKLQLTDLLNQNDRFKQELSIVLSAYVATKNLVPENFDSISPLKIPGVISGIKKQVEDPNFKKLNDLASEIVNSYSNQETETALAPETFEKDTVDMTSENQNQPNGISEQLENQSKFDELVELGTVQSTKEAISQLNEVTQSGRIEPIQ